jgi:hypothetical protein
VAPQLVDHSLAENLTLDGVVHDVQRNQSSAQRVITHGLESDGDWREC